MAETFYGALGVAEDADDETIRRAYREQVKRHHPDVSDDPDAPERFKRLTTARTVLVDSDERTRYDRLGHAEYVETHVESAAWKPRKDQAADRRAGTADEPVGGSDRASDGGYDWTAWLGEDSAGTRRQHRRGRRRRGHSAGATTAKWQHASEAYRRTDTEASTGRQSSVLKLLRALRLVGPWVVVHLIFVGSAATTAWLAFTELASRGSVPWPTLLLGVGLIGMTVLASVLHVVSQLYS